jgi:hypothetical protein
MKRRRASWPAILAVAVSVVTACGGAAAPDGSASSSTLPAGSAPAGSGPPAAGTVPFTPPVVDLDDDLARSFARLEDEDQARLRTQAGMPAGAGPGWNAMVEAADAALDGALRSIAEDFEVDPQIGSRDGRLASAAGPPPADGTLPTASAAAMALIMGALTTGRALGSGGTTEASSTSTETRTSGDEVATMTAKMTGRVVSTGSRVEADFTFELSGTVVNNVTGATAQLQGNATAHFEIDGCPDANGSSKGSMSLVSSESVSASGPDAPPPASWTRDLSGAFDIAVDDDAAISGVSLDASASESVTGGGGDDHELGVRSHWEASAGQGFEGFTPDVDGATGEVTHDRDSTDADLRSLFRSAAQAISAAAVLLGYDAEKFWRGGKCLELLVDPAGGDVDADSKTDVVAKVRHRFEGDELDKPVEATLDGVQGIDPANEEQPAPATITYMAGSEDGDVGNIAFKTVSKRGIAEKTVTFTVKPAAWDVAFTGTDVESFGPVSNDLKATISDLRITAADGVLSGAGKLHLKGTVTSGACSGPLDQVAAATVTGTLVGTGDEAVMRIVIGSVSPPGDVVHMRCKPSGGADIPAEGHVERYGEALGTFDLPAVAGPTAISKTASIGGILKVTIKGTFTVALVAAPPGG